jgi:hypothetical protein
MEAVESVSARGAVSDIQVSDIEVSDIQFSDIEVSAINEKRQWGRATGQPRHLTDNTKARLP